MPARYIKRSLETVIKRAAKEFPVIVLTGPRQSGKTTLLKHLFAKKYRYVSLEPPDVRASACGDPRGFIDIYSPPVIFDEVQYAPDLLPYIKEKVDEERSRAGQYLLSGSQNLLLLQTVTESLAGRAGIFRLLPLSRREALGEYQSPLPWETKHGPSHPKKVSGKTISPPDLWLTFLRGGYPELWVHPKRDITSWHSSYVQTYLERDVRSLRQVGDLTQFQSFLRAIAARSAQLLNLTDLARDLGLALNTVKAWISVLEATHQVFVVRPYYANVGKRLVKTPKVYFTDVGTLCFLAGLRDPEHAASGPMGGALMETAVLSEIMKTLVHQGEDPKIYFWRTSNGIEVDFIVDTGKKLIPIEVKLSATPRPAMASSINTFRKDLGERAVAGYVVHTGKVLLPLSEGNIALPFADL